MKKNPKFLKVIDPNGLLTEWQEKVIRCQIRRNSAAIEVLIYKVDLLKNKEGCPKNANTLVRLRKQLAISMDENDTFRKVLARHIQIQETWKLMPENPVDPMTYLVNRIKSREKAMIAGLCMKGRE